MSFTLRVKSNYSILGVSCYAISYQTGYASRSNLEEMINRGLEDDQTCGRLRVRNRLSR